MLRVVVMRRYCRFVNVRIFKESQLELRFQDAAHGAIDLRHRDAPFLNKLRETVRVRGSDRTARKRHLHIHAGRDRPDRCVSFVCREAVGHEITHGIRVTHYESLEAPLLPQNVAQQKRVAGRRHVVEIHVGRHRATHTRVDRGLERWEVDVVKLRVTQIRRVVIAASVGRAVAREVFHAREQTSRR